MKRIIKSELRLAGFFRDIDEMTQAKHHAKQAAKAVIKQEKRVAK